MPDETAPQGTSDQSPGSEPTNSQQDLETWKKHARTWETRAKESAALAEANADAARRLKEIEDEAKSEADKLKEQLDSAKSEAGTAASELAVLKAALAHGLSGDDIELLNSSKPIEERVAALAERLKSAPQSAPPSGSAGQVGDDVHKGAELSAQQVVEQAISRRP